MEAIIEEFEQRVAEVESYLKVLARLEDPDVVLYHRVSRRRVRVFGQDSFKVMKATVFLLIYNLVECSIRSAFGRLYEQIETEGKTLGDVRDELRQIWVGQQFRSITSEDMSPTKYRDIAQRLADEILQESVVKLSPELLPISGNLDADAIRKVCHLHGVSVKTHHRSQGGGQLKTVRQQRNGLGHGNVSFTDCGQQYAVSDLKRIKKQAEVFVRGILKNIKRYLDDGAYAV